jgi:signal transduction histidine kinase
LLSEIQVSDAMKKDPGFVVELSGAFAGTEAQWPTLLSHTNWMIEIDARGDVVRYRMTPSLLTRKQNPTAQAKNFSSKRQPGAPEFVARIFVRDGSTTGNKLPQLLDRFAKESSGIRVYSEGFRVLPYGSPRNDWLGIDADYAQRANLAIDEADSPELSGDEIAITQGNERVYVRPGSSYFGGVFLLDETSHGLEMVINREGYLPNSSFDQMTSIIRRGVDLAVRVRAAVGIATKQDDDDRKKREQEKERDKLLDQHASLASSTPLKSMSPIQRLDTWVGAGRSAATALRASTSSSSSEVRQMVGVLSAAIEEVNSVAETARDEQAQIRVLASIGTQMGAFVHEINGVLGQARVIMERLGQLIDSHPESARELRAVRKAQAEMIASLERQAVYLSDSLDAESRRRRARQIVKDRVATAFRLLGPTAAGRQVELIDLTDANAKTPPMFPAEVNVILTNLLSNAIKAASTAPEGKRKIRVYATRGEQSTLIRVSNTGTSVDLDDSDRWFRPFESTTSNIDTVLGQGLGLGLSLTRRIVEEYGGTIQFVEPDDTFATAIDVTLPTR